MPWHIQVSGHGGGYQLAPGPVLCISQKYKWMPDSADDRECVCMYFDGTAIYRYIPALVANALSLSSLSSRLNDWRMAI